MTKIAVWLAAGLVLLVGALFAHQRLFASDGRSDCPGTVVCPINGQEVCKDRCPLIDPDRPDCPGKVQCPVTGDLVCSDPCPLGPDATKDGTTPSCCQGRK